MERLTLLADNSQALKTLQRGFTLIEVLVALAILAAGFSVIFQMFQQSGITANRIQQVQHRVDVEQSIFMELSHINPSANQQGVGSQGDITFQWRATPISPLLRLRSEDNTNQNHVQIFTINVVYQEKKVERSFEFEQMGWERKTGVSREASE
ncbi:type II secretion system protein [Vibrio vulnificus]|uniref:type II secretion system protein n=1 Tax=Vibrio vulnificus TaxID=672 RepID=UPI0010296B4F|nr:prepilin-type N-terminal cleavage/methylation domain-containing protein [Vibrio vulnificus]MCG6313698.1 prepilin-type N-terminal cleavage/methylation domain-containing protein [Vibrio vulnificus]RZP84193.1 type II secretion system protein [Vibrio vulnificus]RZP84477.1 type II secretion system protein [Vibrio vulnificus]RZR25123.1 type II secretion system protein [Vibrio vulnificus]HAS6308621.1 prepilin-type N-terminal cleavage/methylation domain-containing protein [Vibrio vulnificus]